MNLPTAPILVAASLLVLASCGGTGPDEPTVTPTPTPTPDHSPTPTPASRTAAPEPTETPIPTATPEPPDAEFVAQIARSANYFVYHASAGDTVPHVAHRLGGVPGREGTLVAFLDELMTLNQLVQWDLLAGQTMAVPLIPDSIGPGIPLAHLLSEWATDGGENELQLYWPSARLINDGYQGALVLQAFELVRSDAEIGRGDVTGYVMTFSETDRPVLKGGELDTAAVVVGRAFAVTCGPHIALLDPLPTDSVDSFGDQCLLTAPRGGIAAATISGLLETVAPSTD